MAGKQTVTDRQVLVPGGNTRNNYQTEVIARPVDTGRLPSPATDESVGQLVAGLSKLSTKMFDYMEEKNTADFKAGAAEKAAGAGAPSDASWAREQGYMAMSGAVKGDQDGVALWDAYHTQFDKDGGNLDDFLAQQYGSRVQGMEANTPFRGHYDAALAKRVQQIREAQGEYQNKKVTETSEANAMYLLNNALQAHVSSGTPVPEETLGTIRDVLKAQGVSGSRFNELLFSAAKKFGDEGNFGIYDMFKRDRPDGTPGMYYIPKMKEQIDAAQAQAVNAFIKNRDKAEDQVRKDREARQDASMLSIMLEHDPEKATKAFDGLVKSGTFSNASELLKWRKELDASVKRDARADQMETANTIQMRIMDGTATMAEIRDADLTPEQKRSLWSDMERKRRDDRVANAQVRAANAQERAASREDHKVHIDYLKEALKASPSSIDMFGEGTETQRRLRATAVLEAQTRISRGESPSAVVDEVAKRYIPRFKEMGTPPAGTEVRSLLRYNTPQELSQALREGRISRQEFDQQAGIFRQIRNK